MTTEPATAAANDATATVIGPLPGDKPRVVVMGEFSAGKSTLTNLLLGATPLPVRVTATRLPPVWIAQGEPGAWREDFRGNLMRIDTADLGDVQPEDTRLVRMTMQADVLEMCDIIDTPGISDPNMPCEIWQRVLAEADHVIWCTHATQAWRQSEAAVWESVPEGLRAKSLLLVTRMDRIAPGRDRKRVLARLRRETRGLFADILPVSLADAMKAGDDRAKWDASGAGLFLCRLAALVATQNAPPPGSRESTGVSDASVPTAAVSPPPARPPTEAAGRDAVPGGPEKVAVLPRRVVPVSDGQCRRPRPQARPAGPGHA